MKFVSRNLKIGILATIAVAFATSNLSCLANEGPHSGERPGAGVGKHGYQFGNRFQNNHPRRAETLGRDNRLNHKLNSDRGNLGGHIGQLKGEQRGIRNQEQSDARANGGHITPGEKSQLNHEENHLNNQIQRDHN
jgi:hypothetical protein